MRRDKELEWQALQASNEKTDALYALSETHETYKKAEAHHASVLREWVKARIAYLEEQAKEAERPQNCEWCRGTHIEWMAEKSMFCCMDCSTFMTGKAQ